MSRTPARRARWTRFSFKQHSKFGLNVTHQADVKATRLSSATPHNASQLLCVKRWLSKRYQGASTNRREWPLPSRNIPSFRTFRGKTGPRVQPRAPDREHLGQRRGDRRANRGRAYRATSQGAHRQARTRPHQDCAERQLHARRNLGCTQGVRLQKTPQSSRTQRSSSRWVTPEIKLAKEFPRRVIFGA